MKRTILCLLLCASSLAAQTGAKNGEWKTYGGDLGNTHYSPLDQINASNFNSLQIAWRFKTDNLVRSRNSTWNRRRSWSTVFCIRQPEHAVLSSRSMRA